MAYNSKTLIRICIFILLLYSGYEQKIYAQSFVQFGKASFYAKKFNGKLTSNGEIFSNSKMTAAHPTLPFNTIVRVTNLENNKFVDVRVNDRGPKSKSRIIDVTRKAARELEITKNGTGNVKLEVMKMYNTFGDSVRASLESSNSDFSTDPNIATDSVNISKSGFYKISIKDIAPFGYGILLGTYSIYSNLLKRVDTLQKTFTYSIVVQSIKEKDQPIYMLMLGPFDDKAQAGQALIDLKSKKIDGVILLLKP